MEKKPYRILTIDGGGVRAVFSARLLERLFSGPFGAHFLAHVDLVAGCSAGGLVALLLAAGRSPPEACSFLQRHSEEIFHASAARGLTSLFGLLGARHGSDRLQAVLRDCFGDRRLDDLQKRVLIPAFQLDPRPGSRDKRSWKAKFFHNFPGPDSDGSEGCVDVALRGSAAPTFFPTAQGHIDGGMVANNPSMAALAQALNGRGGPRQRLEDVALLSIGAGVNPSVIEGDRCWGAPQWAPRLVDIMVDGDTR